MPIKTASSILLAAANILDTSGKGERFFFDPESGNYCVQGALLEADGVRVREDILARLKRVVGIGSTPMSPFAPSIVYWEAIMLLGKYCAVQYPSIEPHTFHIRFMTDTYSIANIPPGASLSVFAHYVYLVAAWNNEPTRSTSAVVAVLRRLAREPDAVDIRQMFMQTPARSVEHA